MLKKKWLSVLLIFVLLTGSTSIIQYLRLQSIETIGTEKHLANNESGREEELDTEEPALLVNALYPDGLFSTESPIPIKIAEKGSMTLYVLKNKLYQYVEEQVPAIIMEWSQAELIQVWENHSTLLLGIQKPITSQEQWDKGEWYLIHMPVEQSEKAKIEKIDTTFFGPEQVIQIKMTHDPELYFITWKQVSGFIGEYLYQPGSADFISINPSLSSTTAFEEYQSRKIQPSEYQKHFSKQQRFDLTNVSIYIFQDEWGTIVYYWNGSYPFVQRFPDYQPIDLKEAAYSTGDPAYLLLLVDSSGNQLIRNISSGYDHYFPYEVELWEEEWNLLQNLVFYQVKNNHIKIIKYELDYHSVDRYWYVYKTLQRSYLLNSETFQDQIGDILQYKVGDSNKYLSLHDLVNFQSKEEVLLPSTLWIEDFPPSNIEPGKKPFWYMEDEVEIELPGQSLFLNNPPYSDEMQQLYNAVNQLEHLSGGDYGPYQLYKKIEDVWYLLIDKWLFRYSNQQFIEVGELPVSIIHRVGEGVSGEGPQDYIRHQGSWYVADTYGHRVLKLNDQLEMEEEYRVILPNKFSINPNGHLEVTCLSGKTEILNNGKLVTYPVSPTVSIAENEKEVRAVGKSRLFIDQELGYIWYISYEGNLLRYHPAKNEAGVTFVGHSYNARFHNKILPYQQSLLLLMDHKLLLFDRQKGTLEKMIEFPRGNPDGMYSETSFGEGSYHLDRKKGRLFLVQGYRVLQIDIKTGVVNILFEQHHADLGLISYANNSIYFTLRPNNQERFNQEFNPEKALSQLIKIDVGKNNIRRYLIEGFYQVDSIAADKLILWMYQPPWYGTEEGYYKTIPLKELKK